MEVSLTKTVDVMRAQRTFTVTPLAHASRHFAADIDSPSGSSMIIEEHLRDGSTRGLVIDVSQK